MLFTLDVVFVLAQSKSVKTALKETISRVITSNHYPYPLDPIRGDMDLLEPIPAVFGQKAGVHPGQVASPSPGE